MKLPTAKDELTGVPVSRVTSGEGTHLLPYYTANALSADGRYVCCTYGIEGPPQAWIYSMETGEGKAVSAVEGGVLHEGVAFHPLKPWLLYASPSALFRYDLETEKTEELFRCNEGFNIKSEISVGQEHVVFWIYEVIHPGRGRDGSRIDGFHMMRSCRSYIFAARIETGHVFAVWGDTSPLTHPVISPVDENIVLYADQGVRERLQELFTIPLFERDNRHPLKLYRSTEQRPVYVGHSFFTCDGWVGTQLIEFGGLQPDGSYADMYGCNAIIRPDGTCDRRARCPGGNKPPHSHAAYSNSWWVGDAHPEEGKCNTWLLTVMKNNWETGYCQAEPLAAHGCSMERPYHVHPRLTRDEKMVLFNSNFTGHCQVYAAHVEEFLAAWQDRVPFEKRPWRYCRPPLALMGDSRIGPKA